MVTKYNPGDRVLIPATLTGINIEHGEISYTAQEIEYAQQRSSVRVLIPEWKIEGYATKPPDPPDTDPKE